jgi:hypothetical protein
VAGSVSKVGDVAPGSVRQFISGRIAAALEPSLRDELVGVGAPDRRVGVQDKEGDNEALLG